MESEESGIERSDTAVRILLTLLFYLIARAVGFVLGVVIVFELIYMLITKEAPPERVRQFANRAVSYFYRVGRYLTYNELDRPFPFSDFPPEVEPPAPIEEAANARG
jgi:hypothetical protein